MIGKHLTMDRLNQYVDNRLDAIEASEVLVHLKECRACLRTHESLAKVDASLRVLPLEHVHADFTRNVLTALSISPQTSVFFRIVEHLPYVFGLMIVIGVMLAAFIGTGVIPLNPSTETETRLDRAWNALDHSLTATVTVMNSVGQKYFSFLYSSGTMRLVLMSVVSVGLMFLLDRFLGRRFLTRV
jgi:anti-sigma factor RsiW